MAGPRRKVAAQGKIGNDRKRLIVCCLHSRSMSSYVMDATSSIKRRNVLPIMILLACLVLVEGFLPQSRKTVPVFSSRLHSTSSSSSSIRYLGKGPDAIVRPGAVLLAPADEFHHFLRQSAVFIYAMGTNENDDYVIRGCILDHPTPFTMGEMMKIKNESGGVYDRLIYRGGDTGGESAFCLHSFEELGSEEIGTSGIYQGGDLDAMSDPMRVKFFFNFMEFTEQELEDMLEVKYEDGDCWTAVEVPPEIVLDSDYDRGELWARLRNAVREDRN